MPEDFRYVKYKETSTFFANIAAKEKGILVEGRHFPKAIGIIGGGTGLEGLRLAKENPDAAIFIIDPYVRFASKVISQISSSDYQRKKEIDWTFFVEDEGLQLVHEQLFETYQYNPKIWKKIEAAFNRYSSKAKELSSRMFFIDAMTDDYIPKNPIFDRIDLIYPNPQLYQEPSLYKFVSRSLRKNGTWTVITELPEGYIHYYGHEKPYVVSHGEVKRDKIKDPLSVYDIIFGQDYKFIDIKKIGEKLKEPGLLNILLAETAPWSLIQLASELTSKKRTVKYSK